jgi:hypothetical protein
MVSQQVDFCWATGLLELRSEQSLLPAAKSQKFEATPLNFLPANLTSLESDLRPCLRIADSAYFIPISSLLSYSAVKMIIYKVSTIIARLPRLQFPTERQNIYFSVLVNAQYTDILAQSQDVISGDELMADSYDMKEIDAVVYEVDCAMITESAVAVGEQHGSFDFPNERLGSSRSFKTLVPTPLPRSRKKGLSTPRRRLTTSCTRSVYNKPHSIRSHILPILRVFCPNLQVNS